jgi:hypothetical protein
VQTCRGSHTHTVVDAAGDNDNVYIYVSGTSGVRSADELPGCADGGLDDPNSARFRLEVIKVPLKAPETAAIVSSPRIFNALPVPPRNPERDARDARNTPAARGRGRTGCGGSTGMRPARQVRRARLRVRPLRLAAGAAAATRGRRPGRTSATTSRCIRKSASPAAPCAGLGLLLDIRDAAHPQRVDFVADPNMSFWHSATVQQRRQEDPVQRRVGRRLGAALPRHRQDGVGRRRALHHRAEQDEVPQLLQDAGGADGAGELRRAQRLADPDPGRDVMVQAWYQGGLSVFDWTDVAHPKEIAFFDRGRCSRAPGQRRLVVGVLVQRLIMSSEIARGSTSTSWCRAAALGRTRSTRRRP